MRNALALSALVLASAGLTSPASGATLASPEALPARVRRIVLHALGNPSYDRPELRFAFFPPSQTHSLWKRGFGAHWIVWTDGSLWPRRVSEGPRGWRPQSLGPATSAERRRLAWEASPVYSHLHNGNSRSVGVELAHSGRRGDPIPAAQLQSTAWLVRTLLEMSHGRLGPRDVVGHKDVDRRPAFVHSRCARAGCPVFVDPEGRPYRRRVDPPESLFAGLARYGLVIPRPAGGDDELLRAERLPDGRRPAVARLAAVSSPAGRVAGATQ